jgi:hypothetical protein
LSSILKEMPHRMRKIVSKCRSPFIGSEHRRHSLAATHHCMCSNNFTSCFFLL